ncbi:MAG: YeeE/YedE family protein [Sedimenticolaceae bacterium]
MSFESFFEAQSFMLWAVFIIALVMGAVVNKTNFCTMGAVSDFVNMGDTGRLRAWLLAMAVAILGVTLLEYAGLLNLSGSFPPYRNSNIVLAENILGGLMFGVGMTLASGCGNKCLVRIGGGNIKSIIVFLIVGVLAYFMINPFPGSDKTIYSVLFYGWTSPMSVDVLKPQDIGSLVGGSEPSAMRLIVGVVVFLAMGHFIFKSKEFRSSADNMIGGAVVGLAVLAAWFVSGNVIVDADGEILSLQQYYNQWDMLADSDAGKPAAGAMLATQSYTFINPMGQALNYLAGGLDGSLMTFGVVAVFGVVAGSLIWSLISRSFRIEWFSSASDVANHVIGAVLMGIGGTLAMGCTIGQAVTGISTLAVGSILTFGAIFLGSALTMKIQYYKMVYEDEATVMKSLITGLVDLKLLPKSMRKFDAI